MAVDSVCPCAVYRPFQDCWVCNSKKNVDAEEFSSQKYQSPVCRLSRRKGGRALTGLHHRVGAGVDTVSALPVTRPLCAGFNWVRGCAALPAEDMPLCPALYSEENSITADGCECCPAS